MIVARKSTARTVTIGPLLDADGAFVTTAVLASFKLSKNGGAPAALDGSATVTYRTGGCYSLALTANDLDTVGQAEVVPDSATNSMPTKEITVLTAASYDAIFASGAAGFPANFAALAVTGAGKVTVGTNDDKTGYALTQAFPANFAALLVTGAGKVTVGANDDKTGYALTQAFPLNFPSLAITGSGVVAADVLAVNSAPLQGDGTSGNPWGPA